MAKYIYKRKFYNNRFIRKYISLSMRVTHFLMAERISIFAAVPL